MAKKMSAGSSRESARQAHAQQLAAEKRRSRTITWTIVGVAIAVIAIIVVVVMMNSSRSIPDAGPAPTAATESGGILLVDGVPGDGNGPDEVDASEVEEPDPDTAGQMPTEVPGADNSDIIIYADANCVYCAQFEMENAEALDDPGADRHTIEYRFVNYLDNPGTENFSSRAANAMTCVAEESPEQASDYINAVFTSYNTHQGAGLSNEELTSLASETGADITECISDNTYRPFVDYTTAHALKDGIGGTPSIWVDGEQFENTANGESFQSWAQTQLQD